MTQPVFDNSYARLPEAFYAPAEPAQAPSPALMKLNHRLAESLGLDVAWLESDAGLAMMSGQRLPAGAAPIAMAYAGHQFGGWSPRLGDGRAILVGEVLSPSGERFDIQLKGAGRTHFSRSGDGKAGMGPVMREYIVSEAMAALGVPTTRALAAVSTGEPIFRNPPEPGAVITRVAKSHVRIGTFQYFYARDDSESVRLLADYVIERHYPDATAHDNRYRGLFEQIMQRQAELIPHWMSLGFIHGVMNTDNVQIAGETLDYGPCAFIDNFHPDKVFSSIDRNGRYAWGNQPAIAQWNLTRLAETLLPLLDKEQEAAIEWVKEALAGFRESLLKELASRFRAKLGLFEEVTGHGDMVDTTLATLADNEVDFTLFFRQLTRVAGGAEASDLRALFSDPESCDAWLATWRHQIAQDPDPAGARVGLMQRHNPIFIPRNHRVQQAIEAGYNGDYQPFERLTEVLSQPYREQPEHAEIEHAPQPAEVVHRTFCGT